MKSDIVFVWLCPEREANFELTMHTSRTTDMSIQDLADVQQSVSNTLPAFSTYDKNTKQHNESSPLLRLPLELRQIIYHLTLDGAGERLHMGHGLGRMVRGFHCNMSGHCSVSRPCAEAQSRDFHREDDFLVSALSLRLSCKQM